MQIPKQSLSVHLNNLVRKISSSDENRLAVIFSCLAFLMTLWVLHIQQGAINSDSVLYFEAARLFSIGEWHQGFALFGWPLYSLLIAALHNLTGLSIEATAQFLTAILFTITTFSFITLIRLSGGNKTTIVCGAALLLSSSYIVGDILHMLMRDQGFWAFFLTGLVFFIRFYRDGRLQDALLWQASCIVAMFFRIEAMTFLALLPFALIVNTTLTIKERLVRLAKAHMLNFLVVGALFIMLIFMPSLSSTDLGRLQEIWELLTEGFLLISQNFNERSVLMANEVLGPYLDDYGSIGLMMALIGIALMKIINTAGWVATGLIVLGPKDQKPQIKADAQFIFIVVSSLALLNMATILLRSYVLSSRYIIALGFMLLIFSSYPFVVLVNSVKKGATKVASRNFEKWVLILVITIVCLSFVRNIIPKREGYAYENEAVVWVKKNTPKNSSIFYVSPRARYYAGAPYAGRDYEYWDYVTAAIKNGTIFQYNYLVINLETKDLGKQKQLEEALRQYSLTREFIGPRGKKKILFFSRK